jgi:hypothetical protein
MKDANSTPIVERKNTATDSGESARQSVQSSVEEIPSVTPAIITQYVAVSLDMLVILTLGVQWSDLLSTHVCLRHVGLELFANWTEAIQYVLVQEEKLEIPSSDASKMVKSAVATYAVPILGVVWLVIGQSAIVYLDLKAIHLQSHA